LRLYANEGRSGSSARMNSRFVGENVEETFTKRLECDMIVDVN
jgi:hypothetical protein